MVINSRIIYTFLHVHFQCVLNGIFVFRIFVFSLRDGIPIGVCHGSIQQRQSYYGTLYIIRVDLPTTSPFSSGIVFELVERQEGFVLRLR